MVYIDQLLWPQGKKKAFTLSYDDGVTQDLQLIDLFGQYGVKATFNLNPGLFGDRAQADIGGRTVRYDRLTAQEIPVQYAGQDIAAHGWHHVFPWIFDGQVVRDQRRRQHGRVQSQWQHGTENGYGEI